MLKYRTATSLVALALLGCFVNQEVEAQGPTLLQPRLSIRPPPGQQTPSNPWTPPNPPPILPGPQKPSDPWTPPGPQRPSDPWTPTGPQRPSDPWTPTGPQRPSDPWTPTGPQKPSDPWTPPIPPILPGPQKPSDPWTPPIPPILPGPQKPSPPWTPPIPPILPGPQKPSPPWTPPGPQKPSPPWTPPRPQKPSDPWTPPIPPILPGPQKPSPPWTPPRPQKPSDPWIPLVPKKPSDPWILPVPKKPSDPSTPPGPQKPPNPWTPTSQHPPSFSKKPPKYVPRATPAKQVSQPTPYDPSKYISPHTGSKNPTQDTCEVDDRSKIPCGTPDISTAACLEIGCCFDGHRCYFGKAVTVQCTKDGYFIVVVAKDATLPALDLNRISLYGEGPSCTYVDSNSEFAIYYFAVTQCGTLVREEEPGVIIYENIMASYFDVQSGHLGEITRDSTYNLFFQCRYTATSVNSLVIELLPSDPPQPVASIGPVRVLMRLANGKCTTKGCNEVEAAFTSFYTDEEYPVQKVLKEPVYVQVEILERTDPLVVLTLDHCWTTTSPNPHTFPQWDILINGCPNPADPYTSELVSVTTDVEFPEHYKRFLFKMFAFVDRVSVEPTYQQIYLHCSTSLCIAAPGRQCFPACFTKLKKREATTTEKRVERNVVVTAGPVTISAPES